MPHSPPVRERLQIDFGGLSLLNQVAWGDLLQGNVSQSTGSLLGWGCFTHRQQSSACRARLTLLAASYSSSSGRVQETAGDSLYTFCCTLSPVCGIYVVYGSSCVVYCSSECNFLLLQPFRTPLRMNRRSSASLNRRHSICTSMSSFVDHAIHLGPRKGV